MPGIEMEMRKKVKWHMTLTEANHDSRDDPGRSVPSASATPRRTSLTSFTRIPEFTRH